jgi:Restriction alleviation protein Lar
MDNATTDLLPCPFCECEKPYFSWYRVSDGDDEWSGGFVCGQSACGASGPHDLFGENDRLRAEREMAAQWNNRPRFNRLQSGAQDVANTLSETVKEAEEVELELRQLMWAGHGHLGIYGDDGEMQCAKCRVDYKRAPLHDVRKAYVMAQLARAASPS